MTITVEPDDHRAAAPVLGVDPSSLSLQHRVPRLPALAVRTEQLPQLVSASVELRLLGSGHQVVLRLGETEWIETLAQMPGRLPHLPTQTRVESPLPGSGPYEARCTLSEHSERGLVKQRERFQDQSSTAQASLVLRGGDGAAAAVCLYLPDGDDELQWRTWRTQPATGRLVQTVSTLRLPPAIGQSLRAS